MIINKTCIKCKKKCDTNCSVVQIELNSYIPPISDEELDKMLADFEEEKEVQEDEARLREQAWQTLIMEKDCD